MKDQNARRPAAILLAAASLAFIAALLASCAGLPPALPGVSDERLPLALPAGADLYLRVEPSGLSATADAVLRALPGREASQAATLLRDTRLAWLAVEAPASRAAQSQAAAPEGPGEAPAPSGSAAPARGSDFSAVLLGSYPSAALRAALASAKGARVRSGYVELPGGLSVCVLSSRCIIATTGDMGAFLERCRALAAGAPPNGPLAELAAAYASAPAEGRSVLALAPQPAATIAKLGLEDFSDLPLVRLGLSAGEKEGAVALGLSFGFPSEDDARVYGTAARMIAGAIKMKLGSGGRIETARKGNEVEVSGLTVSPQDLASLVASMAAKGDKAGGAAPQGTQASPEPSAPPD